MELLGAEAWVAGEIQPTGKLMVAPGPVLGYPLVSVWCISFC
ncbi:hypothetical protein [Pasteuria penetrans]|nr:hypothetical protein [Pasteuria penetrans]